VSQVHMGNDACNDHHMHPIICRRSLRSPLQGFCARGGLCCLPYAWKPTL
jgi:hypothetical protein